MSLATTLDLRPSIPAERLVVRQAEEERRRGVQRALLSVLRDLFGLAVPNAVPVQVERNDFNDRPSKDFQPDTVITLGPRHKPVHGIIVEGGEQPNIIPEHTRADFYLRSLERDYCDELLRRFQAAAEGAATATGCRVTVTPEAIVHEPLRPNTAMAELFGANLERIGFPEDPEDPEAGYGSTDCGNVSQALPTIHPYIRISPDGIPGHSRAFAEWARSPMARAGMVAGAKALALTALDLLASPEALQKAKADFIKGG